MDRTQISERIRREARVAGLRDVRAPSLEAVERRRTQLWILAAVLVVALASGAVVLSMWPGRAPDLGSPAVLRLGIVLLSVAFCAYAFEKELHLRRLTRLLTDEQVLNAALANRLREVSLLLEAGKAMNSVLDLEAVLGVILGGALRLLDASGGAVLLAQDGQLAAAAAHGDGIARGERLPLGEGTAGRVALTRDPLIAEAGEGAGSELCVPLLHREELLGVLAVRGEPGRTFSEYDLRVLATFAEQAAAAIANARLYEAERSHVAELLEVDRMKSEFVALVTHELRTPLTTILAAAETARRPGVREQGATDELLGIIAEQSKRLAGMVEDLLAAARVERRDTAPSLAEVDLAVLARLAARDFGVAGRPVEVEGPDHAPVVGDALLLRRILDNLLDNAHKYGAPPVRLVLEDRADRILLSVVDAGAGVPPEARERIFERFARLDDHRSKPGLGLGLPIVRGLAEACGGRVWVEDAPGGGAAFRVDLRAARVPAREAV
ncbi:MAG TPA: ATP-binding protein [Actinomycetota bacterium]|nr:ATP-binding protein [Actinomycetota bacterium]